VSYDIYGQRLRLGHCEVHPDVAQPFPCDCCYSERSQPPQPEPCESCYYATAQMQECDGTCERLPQSEWEYFKHLNEYQQEKKQ
jgi:hypothetical protein